MQLSKALGSVNYDRLLPGFIVEYSVFMVTTATKLSRHGGVRTHLKYDKSEKKKNIKRARAVVNINHAELT